jgi:protein-S-isoprenylcysteine O-methyltransferase Ste14
MSDPTAGVARDREQRPRKRVAHPMKLLGKALLGTVVAFLFVALALFLPAGTVRWPAGWTLVALLLGFQLVQTGMLFASNPSLLEERLRLSHSDQGSRDRVLASVNTLGGLLWAVLMPLDAVRFRWSHMPLFLQILGTLLLLVGWMLTLLAFRENAFLARMVRVQEERGHTVISTGPYRYVRHPLYAGALILFLGTPLLLGSWYGLLLLPVPIAGLVARTLLEEEVLRERLPGYPAYISSVKYRFIPYVW